MRKILTIIIPTYNMEKYLDRCLSSLLVDDERMNRFEALIINDGSKDSSSEIAHRYQERFPRTFHVIDKTNGHYGSCINTGLKEAAGTFVRILDADDCFDTIVFSRYLDFLSRDDVSEKADVILSNYIDVDNQLTPFRELRYSDYSGPISLDMLTKHDILEWFMPGLTYRTALPVNHGYRQLEGVPYTDQEWAFTPAAYAKTLYRFDASLYLYVHGREGQSVDDAVHAKNIHVETQVIERLISTYHEIDDQIVTTSKPFLRTRLFMLCSNIYQLYLLTFTRFKPSYSPLYSFDRFLKEHDPALYAETSNYTTRIAGIPFQPVKDWRGGNKFRLSLQQTIYRIADWKNHLFSK